jgi:CRP/FNR family transcriptional regulator, dissimilatory nitrate respiration regulator
MIWIMAMDFLAILDGLPGKSVKLRSGEVLFRRGDNVRWFYRVNAGHVRLSRILPRGTEIVLARCGAGGILAEASAFAARYHCDAIAETNGDVLRYPMRDISALMKSHPDAAMAYGAHLASQLMDLRAVMEIRGIRRADDRLLAWLGLRHAADAFDGRGVWPSVAKQIGLTSESLYRALARLERAGKIKRRQGTVSRRA